jgi:hypothetical protein
MVCNACSYQNTKQQATTGRTDNDPNIVGGSICGLSSN